jgi:hypothetical protein
VTRYRQRIYTGQSVAIVDDERLGRYAGCVGIVTEVRRVSAPGRPVRYEYGVDISGRGRNTSAWFVSDELVKLRLAPESLPERRSRLQR